MNFFRSHKPYIIAGPCSAESEIQLEEVARAFSKGPVNMIRAGIWKPRSKPGHFEGKGEEALVWTRQLKTFGLPICVEVASAEQCGLALHYGVDAIWLGARTTVNPFLVQEIADALRGTGLGVMIKNPVSPDIELWGGAVERFQKAGFTHLATIHRGFSVYDPSTPYRNKPIWSIPLEMKRRYPELPMFCDISHISGKRTLLAQVAQRAMDLDFDGLMIESHPHPDQALSDAAQQIEPQQVLNLLEDLQFRKSEQFSTLEIEQIRQVIDTLDAELIDILGRRMELVRKLADIKLEFNLPVFQQERFREIIETRLEWGEKYGFKHADMLRLFEFIHDLSIRTQLQHQKLLQNKSL